PKVYDEVFRVNFLANVQLVSTLDPLLRGSDDGRAIFVTSGLAHHYTPFWSAYAASKAALETMAATYAKEVAYCKLRVNVIDPGVVATELRAAAFPGENAADLPPPAAVAGAFVDLAA